MTMLERVGRPLAAFLLGILAACGPGPTALPAVRLHALSNAACMAHDPHWSVVVTYWGDTTMTWIARADTMCSVTGPVTGGITFGGGGKP